MSTQSHPVTVRDIDIPFGRLVMIFIKLVLAMIPALIVVYVLIGAVGIVLIMLFGGVGGLEQMLRGFGVG